MNELINHYSCEQCGFHTFCPLLTQIQMVLSALRGLPGAELGFAIATTWLLNRFNPKFLSNLSEQ